MRCLARQQRLGAAQHGAHALLVPPLSLHSPASFTAGPRSPRSPSVAASAAATFVAPFPSPSGGALMSPHEPETFLSRYALGTSLGQGTYGSVVAGINRATGDHVAVKIVPKQRHAGRNQRTAVHREANLWRRSQAASRQAARFIGLEEDANNYYIVAEKCDGGSLQAMLDARGSIKEGELLQVAWCVLTFLSDLHKSGIYYGDLKPGNVVMKDAFPCASEGGCLNVRLVDFGCSQLISSTEPLRSMSGSPLFLAPEIIRGSYGLPADMWALGVMLYMLVANRLPFWLEPIAELEQLDMDAINLGIQYNPVIFAGVHWRGVSEELKDLICGLLEKDPARRLSAQAAMKHPWFASVQDMCSV